MKSGFSLPSSLKRFSENSPLPRPVRLMVFRYCFGMIMSVSTLMIFRGAATPSSVVNLSIDRTSRLKLWDGVIYREYRSGKRPKYAILPRIGLDRLHIGVRKPEMVSDLVDQHVADDVAQRFLVFGPVI